MASFSSRSASISPNVSVSVVSLDVEVGESAVDEPDLGLLEADSSVALPLRFLSASFFCNTISHLC